MADYDSYYTTEDLFGAPYPELIAFFEQYSPKGKLLDLGCGQGRDAIPLARLGYSVTGLDNSKVGIDQMLDRSKKEGLEIDGQVDDIFTYDRYSDFDIVILDSMFHFQKNDKKREVDFLTRIAEGIGLGCVICVCIQDTGSKVKTLKETFESTTFEFEVLNDSSLTYIYKDSETGHKSESKYCMFIVKKTKSKWLR